MKNKQKNDYLGGVRGIVFLLCSLFCATVYAQSVDLPPNPEAGKCYVKCFNEKKEKIKWREINCALLNFQTLNVTINDIDQGLSKSDIQTIEATLIPFVKEEYTVHLQSHYVSKESESNNLKTATERAVLIGNYLIKKGMNPELLIVNSYGDSKSDKTNIEYRIVNVSEKTN